jgi:CelD/BcsL family acetyltransferase involved in cellulose biosynthesis
MSSTIQSNMKDSPVKVQIFTTPDVFDVLQAEWNDLVQRSASDSVFSTWEWHNHWWNAYHPGELWVITFRDEMKKLIGIASWFIEQHPQHGRVVRCIGSEDVTDYLDVIVDKDAIDAVYNSLADVLVNCRVHYTFLSLANIPATSPTYTHFPAVLEQRDFNVTTEQQEVCPVIPLPATFEEYLEKILDGKQRGEIRRKLRRADGYNGNMGTLDWYIVDKSHDLEAETDKFMKLMAMSHPEKAAFLMNEQHVAFFKAMIPAMLANGWLQLNFLMIDGEPAAAYLNFDYNNHILVYNSGLNPRRFAELSPGIVLLTFNIRHAIELGRATFDFLRGDEQYKYRMGARNTPVYRLQAQFV